MIPVTSFSNDVVLAAQSFSHVLSHTRTLQSHTEARTAPCFQCCIYATFIENFDGWARAGCDGWSFDDVLPFFKKLEDFKGDGAMLFAVVIGLLLLQMLSLILMLVELLLLILLQK